MHESLHIPNDGRPGRGPRLQPGLTIAVTTDGPIVIIGITQGSSVVSITEGK